MSNTTRTLTARGLAVVLLSALILAGPVSPALATGETWTAIPGTDLNHWNSVAYGDGVWIAVAQDGTNKVMRSTDGGAEWVPIAVPSAFWASVAYGDGVWVAVAFSNEVMRSVDKGLTWTTNGVTGVEANSWRSVAYGDDVWVAVASDGTNRAMRSTDKGLTWVPVGVAGGVAANQWGSVAFGADVFVAVASSDDDRVMRSTDLGLTWVPVGTNKGVEKISWGSVAYGDDVWVAVAGQGGTGDYRVMRSTNGGSDWSLLQTQGAQASQNVGWTSVTYGDGVWIAVASVGTKQVMRSTDGAEWTAIASDVAEGPGWRSVAYGDGVWVAVASTGNDHRVMRSGEVRVSGSGPTALESAGAQGIFLHIVGSQGRTVAGTPVIHGSAGIAPKSPYSLTVQGITAPDSSRTLLASGVTNGGGHVEGRIQLGALASGSYKIVMIGTHRSGHTLVLTNHVVVDGEGKFVSVSPESLQPTLR